MTAEPRGPLAWRSLLTIVVLGIAGAVFAFKTPDTVEPEIAIDHASFSVEQARSTISSVRGRIAGLTADGALELEDGLVAEYPLLEHLAAPDTPRGYGIVLFGILAPIVVGSLGAFILRRSGSRLGWWILVAVIFAVIQGLGVSGTEYLTRSDGPSLLVAPLALAANAGWIAIGVAMLPNLVATFPSGRVLTRRWRWIVWASAAAVAFLVVSVTFSPLYAFDTRVNPLRVLSAPATLAALNIGLALWAGTLFGSVLALVIRFLRSQGDERQQLKWAAVGAGVAGVAGVAGQLMEAGDYPPALAGALTFVPFFVILPVILIVTVFRNRLYDVDIVISKTVTFAIFTTVIAGAYAGAVLVIGAFLGTGVGFEVQVLATVAVAMAFQPVRRYARKIADRLVYGRRATPYQVLARFSHRAAEVADDQVLARVPRLIVDGTGAVAATLWVRTGSVMRPVAVWPEGLDRSSIEHVGGFEDPYADYSLPISNAGEILGGFSLTKARGDSIPPSEERLLAGLASGLGVVLRNIALRSELRQQVEALAASRDRVVAAADEARRALEHDLDSGPQQRLVAVKVMLGPIRKQAETAGAPKTAQILEQLEREAGEAIQAVREFSGGIYPPLLEAEGLATAVTQQAQRAPIPVEVDARDLGRYPREIEAAAYFTILEALQNAAKYAGGTGATVALDERDGTLTFSIVDEGVGFEPSSTHRGSGLSNMADRLDAVGGTLDIRSRPGFGTTVEGTIPTSR